MQPCIQTENADLLAGSIDPSSPEDVLIKIPASNYMEYSPMSKRYTSRIYFTESHGGVLGANAMIGHNVLFDWENGRVGFAKSTCDYRDEKEEPTALAVVEEKASDNCVVAEAALSQTCRESLDLNQCQQNPVGSSIMPLCLHR